MKPVWIVGFAAVAAVAVYAERFQVGRLLAGAGLPGAAAVFLDDPAWRGAALLAAGRTDDAADVLRQTRSPEAAYNLGNALARLGDYASALKAYDLALSRDPDNEDARINRGIVERIVAVATTEEKPKGGVANAGARIDHDPSRMDTTDDTADAKSASGEGMVGNREGRSDNNQAGSGEVGRKGSGASDETEAGQGASSGSATDAAGRAGEGGGATSAAASEEADKRKTEAVVAREAQQATNQWLAAIPDDPSRWLKVKFAEERKRRVDLRIAVQPGGDGW